jgi:hypothetical protein
MLLLLLNLNAKNSVQNQRITSSIKLVVGVFAIYIQNWKYCDMSKIVMKMIHINGNLSENQCRDRCKEGPR